MYRRICLALVLTVLMGAGAVFAAAPEAPRSWLVCFKADQPLPTNASHADVVRFLQKSLAKNMKVIKTTLAMTPLWIGNAVAVKATVSEAAELARLPNVDRVIADRHRRWVDPDIEKKAISAVGPQAIVWSVLKVRAPEVWQEFKIDGTGVVVGHLDTGIHAEHPALKGKVLAFKDFTKAALATPYDDQGHGSHTAGSIAGGDGVGVAPGAKLIVGKIFDRTGSADDSGILLAMQWIMDPDGVPETNDGPRLVSNSWGSDDSTDKVFWDAVNAWVAAGIVPVFAAGNNGPSGKVGTPGAYPHSWAVAATSNKDTLAYFSSIGPVNWDGVSLVKPDIAAPGYGVISCSNTGTGLVSNSGTSMACPHVAGLVALMFQANPALTIDEIRTIAESTAVDLGAAGKDNKFGSGRFDAFVCIKKILETARLTDAFTAYEQILLTEKALVGVGPTSPLAGPLATSLLQRVKTLDEGEFRVLGQQIPAGGAAAQLYVEATRVRTGENLQH